MEKTSEPLIRLTTFGEFTLERFVPSGRTHYYSRIAPEEWGSRGAAVTLLKVLLCRPHRRASRSELLATVWPDRDGINAGHAFDASASLLRRHVLRTFSGESLLYTTHMGGETSFKLPAQPLLWIDADALLALAAQSLAATGQNARTLLEAAHTLVHGEFLEDDRDAAWSQRRRHTLNGARRRVLYKLLELYLKEKRIHQAEELLYGFLEQYPTDEDALYRLMLLLAEQERRREALQLYHYTVNALHEEQHEPASYTRALATRIQHGLALHEQVADYIAPKLVNVLELIQNEHFYYTNEFTVFSSFLSEEVLLHKKLLVLHYTQEAVCYACGG